MITPIFEPCKLHGYHRCGIHCGSHPLAQAGHNPACARPIPTRHEQEARYKFPQGTHVAFDYGTGLSGNGSIVGLATEGLIRLWIVLVEQSTGMPSFYPYSCIVVPESLLKAG